MITKSMGDIMVLYPIITASLSRPKDLNDVCKHV